MVEACWWLPFTPSVCLGVSQGCPHPCGSVGGLGTLWGWRRLLWPRSRCEIGLQVPEAVLGKGWGLFAPCLPVWRGKATSGSQRDTAAGHGQGGVSPVWNPSWGHPVLAAGTKSPNLAASVPQPHPQGFVSARSQFCGGQG